jgi:hypothetical protein
MYEDDEMLSIDSISDYSSMEIRNEKYNNNLFKSDVVVRGYNRVFRKVNNKKVPIYLYTTRYTPGSKIRNAVTGFGDKHIVVGKEIDENLFFKVGLSTGELGNDSYGTHLYFDSPEQYEKHFYTTIDKKIKDAWWIRYRLNQNNIDKELEQPEYTIIH